MVGVKEFSNILSASEGPYSEGGVRGIQKGQNETAKKQGEAEIKRGLQAEQGILARFWLVRANGLPSNREMWVQRTGTGPEKIGQKIDEAGTKLAIRIIRFYQKYISPFFPSTCRFYPTCSNYAIEALSRYGFVKGGLMSIWRVLRCNPFNPGGYDPVR